MSLPGNRRKKLYTQDTALRSAIPCRKTPQIRCPAGEKGVMGGVGPSLRRQVDRPEIREPRIPLFRCMTLRRAFRGTAHFASQAGRTERSVPDLRGRGGWVRYR